jgi:arabinogalactan endo-1,4-beta-galactosidase
MYAATPGGQGLFLRDLASLVARTPGGLGRGIIYWESAWLAGIPWKPGEGNGWDNQTLFDANGQVLESLAAFD